MNKNKFLVVCVVTFLLNINANFQAFAQEATIVKNRYPDYAYEFSGKDKFEGFNRKLFIFNTKLNKFVIRPVNIVWASVMPKYGMERVQNFYTNMEFPIRLVSCLLQKDFKSSGSETLRFLTNTTMGVGGLYDPARTRFKIEPRQEDMGQVLAYYHVKRGPYLVLPIIPSGCVRDIVGQALDVPLNPSSYIIGPAVAMAKAVCLVNKTTNFQALAKTIDYTYADPYDVTKKLVGVEKYIKYENLDRNDVLAEKMSSQNIVAINEFPTGFAAGIALNPDLKSDINFKNYNSQCPLIDSMRTVMFEEKSISDSKWSELSVWNKCFSKQIKTSSVNIDPTRVNYKYRYILQKNKTAPLAIIYPSIGEGIMSHHSIVMAKILYDEGYSVLIQGSPFQWEFVKSMPENYKPGFPAQDAYYLRLVTSKIIDSLQSAKGKQEPYKFDKKILIGSSFGAMTTLFVAAKEAEENTLGISKYISINPPIEILFSLKQVDKFSQDWQNDSSDIKERAALTVGKVLMVSQSLTNSQKEKTAKKDNNSSAEKIATTVEETLPKVEDKNQEVKVAQKITGILGKVRTKHIINTIPEVDSEDAQNTLEDKLVPFPFTEDEAKLVVGFVMKQKLSDLVFTIEHGSKSKKSDIYDSLNNMSFDDYAKKYLLTGQYESPEKLSYDTSLHSIAGFLQKSDKYKIYHTLDDYYVNPEQLSWLKKQSKSKAVYFNKGSHLGFLYRKEFQDEFKKDISLKEVAQIETSPKATVPKDGL